MTIFLVHVLSVLATLCCGIFAGAAIYINVVEHPARMSCGVKVTFAEWAPSHKRATVMQASLAVVGFVLALAAWFLGASLHVLVAGLFLMSVAPFTLLTIMPTNNRLLTLNVEQHEQEVGILLTRWNRLHAVRSALSGVALVLFLLAP